LEFSRVMISVLRAAKRWRIHTPSSP